MTALSRNALRQMMRTHRRAVSKEIAQMASKQLMARILDLPVVQSCQHIAGYFANDGEIDPFFLAEKLPLLGKSYYLPVLDANHSNHLVFVKYQSGDALKLNRYKIPEPNVLDKDKWHPDQLDVVLMPLVAFDEQGGRLGMGGGFYDRTFAFKKKSAKNKPLLIGLAYEFQRVERVDCEVWDVPLDGVVTQSKSILF